MQNGLLGPGRHSRTLTSLEYESTNHVYASFLASNAPCASFVPPLQLDPSPMGPADAAFLARADASVLLKFNLEPWVIENAQSSVEDRARHRFQTPWSKHWEDAEGPLQGRLTPQQRLFLIRNHEAAVEAYKRRVISFAANVRTCVECNRRLVLIELNQTCPSCYQNAAFSVDNDMSLGPRVQDEECLTQRVMRADLFNTLAKATQLELNLVRAVIPVIQIFRIACPFAPNWPVPGYASLKI